MNKNLQSVATRVARLNTLVVLAIGGLIVSHPATAQEKQQKKEVFEEIVVLATRRAENILDVPVAVSSLSGAQIQEAGIKDVWDLQQNVPGPARGPQPDDDHVQLQHPRCRQHVQ